MDNVKPRKDSKEVEEPYFIKIYNSFITVEYILREYS